MPGSGKEKPFQEGTKAQYPTHLINFFPYNSVKQEKIIAKPGRPIIFIRFHFKHQTTYQPIQEYIIIMARITVEDCLSRVGNENRFELIHLAVERVKQHRRGLPVLAKGKNKETVMTLREIASGDVTFENIDEFNNPVTETEEADSAEETEEAAEQEKTE